MSKKMSLFAKAILPVLLTFGLFVSSCKKTAPQPEPEKTEQKAVEELTQEPQEPQAEPAKVEEKIEQAPKSEPDKQASTETGLAPVDIKLPQPVFIGTPEMVTVPDLEKPGELRGPFYAPQGTTNVAAGKPVVCNQEALIGELEMITDSDKEASDGSFVEFVPGLNYITIDLGAEYDIYAIVVWHYHMQARVYFDVIVQVADDADFLTNVKTLFNNDRDNSAGQGVGSDMHYTETFEGRLIDAKGVTSRYVRLYSNGNSGNEQNHYTEVEVYGKAAK